MKTPFSICLIRVLVVITIRLATVSTAHADVPDPGRLAEDLREAHFARIGVAGRTYVLVKPRVIQTGLGFDHIEGSGQRPAIIAGADWDSLGKVPNPVSWSSIDRIEAGFQTRRPGALAGGVMGLALGVTLGALVRLGVSESGEDPGAGFVLGAAAFTTVVGAGIGALFPARRWKAIYPEKSL